MHVFSAVQEVERLRELRAAAPDGRDLNTIRITNDNFKNLKKAQEWWKEAQNLVIVEAAKTAKKKKGSLDEKEIDNRKRKLNLLFEEIKELSQKNSSVTVEKTAVEKEIDAKKTERGIYSARVGLCTRTVIDLLCDV